MILFLEGLFCKPMTARNFDDLIYKDNLVLTEFCERDGRGNPLLWLCGAKATTKIGNRQPGPKGHAQKKIRQS